MGFHEKRSTYITDMSECHILPRHISDLIVPLREMIYKLSINNRMPQVELAVGDKVDILVFRNMEAINDADHAVLRAFSDTHGDQARPLQIWLQPKGPDTCYPIYPLDAPKLTYSLPEYRVEMPYYPTEFTQVNPEINAVMVSRALKFLDPQPGERIADMFCGIGNFTLPIARSGAKVHGMEGARPWSSARWKTPPTTACRTRSAMKWPICSKSPRNPSPRSAASTRCWWTRRATVRCSC